ncbi:replication initiation and membrane attachment family protein [Enterococcus faecalis]|uniref:replication initiation and membrane attachment family protein n=1 Tax=Enterococcus faecalis TaxID=1351 RepID=UPI0035D98BCA
MKGNRQRIQPKNIFQAVIDSPLSDQEKEVLTFLYQPIVGANAFSLYWLLLSETTDSEEDGSLFHADLISLLDLSCQQLEEACYKLEGIGLLETYKKTDRELGDCYLYNLKAPETATRFFKDEVLALVLFNRVGQRKFDQLVQKFQPHPTKTEGYQNVSASFQEVYAFKEEQIVSEANRLTTIQETFSQKEKSKKISVSTDSFDWHYFVEGLHRLGLQLPEDEASFQEEVYVFHQLYGINELDMVDFASKSFDYYTSRILPKELVRTIHQAFDPDKKPQSTNVVTNKQAQLTVEEQQTYRYNALKMNGFSELDIQMIMDSEKNPPIQYLEALKNSRGGYTTPQERSLVKYLVAKSGLPTSVINILINYVYNIQQQPTLKAEYVNRIANEWGQSGIHSPEKAIEHVRELAKQSQTKQKQRQQNYSGKRQTVRQERLPEWADQPNDETKLSPEEQAELDRQIQEFLNQGGDQ